MEFEADAAFATKLDEEDGLAHYREAFLFADSDLIYLDGNSLGRLSLKSAERLKEVVEKEWGGDLIRGWNKDWYEAPSRVGDKIGSLIGAAPGQVVVADSTSVNLFKLVMAALEMRPGRTTVVSEIFNFPSDLYILQGCIQLMGGAHQLRLVPSWDDIHIDEDPFLQSIDEGTALVALSHVAFKSGYKYDIEKIAEKAHQAGALVLVDLSHSAGVVPMELDQWGVDLAVGCTYKYLNGGPGSPAFLYVREELQTRVQSPIWGWFGQQKPFNFDLEYWPVAGIRRFLVGTPSILYLLGLEPALDLIQMAGIECIREKSTRLTSYLIYLVQENLEELGFQLGTPLDPAKRGSHVSLRHPEGYRINRALIEEMAVLPDFREPDHIRLGMAPLYTSFSDVWVAVDRIRRVVIEERYKKYSEERIGVT
jgi:kynureninase